MAIKVIDMINGNVSFYFNVKTIYYGYVYNTIVFNDGGKINLHNMIYNISYFD